MNRQILGVLSRNLWEACGVWRKTVAALIVALVFAFAIGSPAYSQTASTQPKTTAPAKSAASAKTPKPATAPAKTASIGAPVKAYGSSSAPITMEVFSDYECPVCRSLFELTLRPMIGDYVAAGKVYLIHRDFPLQNHKYGYEAARWLNASARVGQFQNTEAALYDNQDAWAADGNIGKYVAGAMSPDTFKRVEKLMQGCGSQASAGTNPAGLLNVAQASGGCAVDSYIEQDRALGERIPVRATPTYVITYKGQKLPAGTGVVSWPILKQFFDSLLSQ